MGVIKKSIGAPYSALDGWINIVSNNLLNCFLNSNISGGVIRYETCVGCLAPDTSLIRWLVGLLVGNFLVNFEGITFSYSCKIGTILLGTSTIFFGLVSIKAATQVSCPFLRPFSTYRVEIVSSLDGFLGNLFSPCT